MSAVKGKKRICRLRFHEPRQPLKQQEEDKQRRDGDQLGAEVADRAVLVEFDRCLGRDIRCLTVIAQRVLMKKHTYPERQEPMQPLRADAGQPEGRQQNQGYDFISHQNTAVSDKTAVLRRLDHLFGGVHSCPAGHLTAPPGSDCISYIDKIDCRPLEILEFFQARVRRQSLVKGGLGRGTPGGKPLDRRGAFFRQRPPPRRKESF